MSPLLVKLVLVGTLLMAACGNAEALPRRSSSEAFLGQTETFAAAEGVEPHRVRATRDSELWPASDGTYFAWAENSRKYPRRFTAWVRDSSGETFKVNTSSANELPGAIDAGRLAYRVVEGGRSDIALYDLEAREQLPLSDQINTRATEWAPTLSGSNLLFGREERVSSTAYKTKIYLWNLETNEFEALDTGTSPSFVYPGQVNGDWAVWTRCKRTCSVVRYHIPTGESETIPNPGVAYSPAVGDDGTAFFPISGRACGAKVAFYRYPVGGPGVLLFTLPRGRDILSSHAFGTQPTRVLFAQVDCPQPGRIYEGDIWGSDVPMSIDAPNPGPNPTIGRGTVTYQVDPAHSGRLEDAILEPPLRRLWQVRVGVTPSYPLLAEDKVFVTVRERELHDGHLYGYDAGSGYLLWFRTVPEEGRWTGIAYEDGRVFVLNRDGFLTAVRAANGDELWSLQLPGQDSFTSEPTVDSGVLFTGGAGSGGTLYAVDVRDGNILWTQDVANGNDSSPALSTDSVFVSYACPNVYAFDRVFGIERWHYDPGCSGGGGSTPVLHQGDLYVRDNVQGYVFDAETGDRVGSFPAGTIPAFHGDRMYSVRGEVLEARSILRGTRQWVFSGDRELTMAPVIANGIVYTGSLSGRLYALDRRTGKVVWTSDLSEIRPPGGLNVAGPTAGFGLGRSILVVPNGNRLTAFVNNR